MKIGKVQITLEKNKDYKKLYILALYEVIIAIGLILLMNKT